MVDITRAEVAARPGEDAPAIEEVARLRAEFGRWLVYTPVLRCVNLERRLAFGTEIWGKLEFLQRTGTFKPRGALSNILRLDSDGLRAGITAVSAGNHAIAASFAAQALGSTARVVMMRSASPVRIDACRQFGADVVLADDVHQAFERVQEISETEGRVNIHPFEGPNVTAGTATLGMEICEQVPGFDVIIVPIGGGGLCSGIASAAKQLNPNCTVIGVEPEGADSMSRSFESGKAEKLAHVSTIADSLGAPFALPYSYGICARYVDEVIRVSDDQLREAMGILYREMKMAVEPACAASTAALAVIRDRLAGSKVVLVFCGSNIDWTTFEQHAWLDA